MIFFAGKPCIVIGDPERIKDILVKESASFYDCSSFQKKETYEVKQGLI